ncbi:MAG TPA: Maf family protein [Acidobacteriota bacterium]|nr:Maf family protein [Acidobacteriota bacterium]
MIALKEAPSIILASASPRRSELLASAGFRFTVSPSRAEEAVDETAPPARQAELLAARKGLGVAKSFPDQFVLAADTVIDLRGELLGKPADRNSAVAMLQRLRGREHRVVTAVFLSRNGRSRVSAVETKVWIRDASDKEIEWYVKTGEPLDKAGSYAIQGLGARLVERIEGCYNNVVGLPLCRVADLLDFFGFSGLPEGPSCFGPDHQPCQRQTGAEARE